MKQKRHLVRRMDGTPFPEQEPEFPPAQLREIRQPLSMSEFDDLVFANERYSGMGGSLHVSLYKPKRDKVFGVRFPSPLRLACAIANRDKTSPITTEEKKELAEWVRVFASIRHTPGGELQTDVNDDEVAQLDLLVGKLDQILPSLITGEPFFVKLNAFVGVGGLTTAGCDRVVSRIVQCGLADAFLWEMFGEMNVDKVRPRQCEECGRYFVATEQHKFCQRKCQEANKTARYRLTPDRNEYQALLMWKRSYAKSHKGRNPSKDYATKWLTSYRKKRRAKGKPVSTRPVKDVLAKL